MKTFQQFKEDIELISMERDPHGEKPRKAAQVHKDYGTKTYSSDRIVARKNHGEIHPGYELHQHSTEMTVGGRSPNGRAVKHKFTIVHKKSGDVAGEMHAWGGKMHPKMGVRTGHKGKGLQVSHLEMHPAHSSKRAGTSLPVAMYRHLHRKGYAIQSDKVQSHGGAHVWNTMRKDPELKKHMMIHDAGDADRTGKHAFQTHAHVRPDSHIWTDAYERQGGEKEKVRPKYGSTEDFARTLILSGKKRKNKKKPVSEDIELAQILNKPRSGGLSPANFQKTMERKGLTPKRSGRIAKGYTMHTVVDKNDPNIEDHHIVHDATGHIAGQITTKTHGDEHTAVHTEIHGDHTHGKIGKSLAVLGYKHLAKKKGNLHSSSLQSPGGASVWNRIRKDRRMKGRVFHSVRGKPEVSAHDVPDKHIWATEVMGGISKTKNTPAALPPSKHHEAEHSKAMGSRLVIRPLKKTK